MSSQFCSKVAALKYRGLTMLQTHQLWRYAKWENALPGVSVTIFIYIWVCLRCACRARQYGQNISTDLNCICGSLHLWLECFAPTWLSCRWALLNGLAEKPSRGSRKVNKNQLHLRSLSLHFFLVKARYKQNLQHSCKPASLFFAPKWRTYWIQLRASHVSHASTI